MADAPPLRAAPFHPDLMDDFLSLHSDSSGLGWCRCVAWWVPSWSGWGQRTANENLALRRRLFEAGNHDGYLFYEGDIPIGWCQVGPTDRLKKLVDSYGLTTDPKAWAITCLTLRPSHRGRGLAHALIKEVLADLTDRGVTLVQAFPRQGQNLDAGGVWTGPTSVYKRAGFKQVRADEHRPIYAIKL